MSTAIKRSTHLITYFTVAIGLALAGCAAGDEAVTPDVPQVGQIVIEAEPVRGKWVLRQPDGKVIRGNGNTTLENMPVGDYVFVWGAIAGHRSPTPNPINRSLSVGRSINFSGTYVPSIAATGTLSIDSNPDALRATWTIHGPGGFIAQGEGDELLSGRALGLYTVTWDEIAGQETPQAQEREVFEGETAVFPGSYIALAPSSTGHLAVRVSPSDAPWSLVGPELNTSGNGDAFFSDVATGDYTITWLSLNGWDTPNPNSQSTTLGSGETASLVNSYGNPNGPSISTTSGSSSNGSSMSIDGENFGSRSAASDIEWFGGADGRIENMPLNTNANSFGPGWEISVSSSATPAHVSTERTHSGNKAIKGWVDHNIPGSWNSGFTYMPGYDFDEIYVSWWMYLEPLATSDSGDGTSPQFKMWRLNATVDPNAASTNNEGEIMSSGNFDLSGTERNDLYTMIWSNDNMRQWDCSLPEPCYGTSYPNGTYGEQWHYDQPFPKDANNWVRWEVYVKASSAPGVRDGSYVYRCFMPGRNTFEVEWEDNIITHQNVNKPDDVSVWNAWTRFTWQNFWANGGDRANMIMDDIYVQVGSRARLELGDAPVWDACTQREIQNVTNWGENSIDFELNHGSYNSGQTAYLYVVRSDGSVSPSRAITLN